MLYQQEYALSPEHQKMFEGRKSIKPDITLTDMSRATILKNHKQFEDVIENIIRYAQDIIVDLPHKKKKLTTDEKKMLIEALLLRACALWENFIEKEIVLLIDLDPSNLLNEFDLPKNTDVNPKLIRAIIFSDHYRDFHDIDHSMRFDELFRFLHSGIIVSLTDTDISEERKSKQLHIVIAA